MAHKTSGVATPDTPPPATPADPVGPTGNAGFGMQESTMDTLRGRAGNLGTRLGGIAGELRGLHLGPTALGPVGLPVVPALNAANDNAVTQADRGATAFGNIQSGLRATHVTATNTDTHNASTLTAIDPTTKPPMPRGAGGDFTPAGSPGSPGALPPVPKVHDSEPPVTPRQRTMLDLHGMRAVRVKAADPHGSLVEAVAATVSPDSPDLFTAKVNDRTSSASTVADVAAAGGVRVHVLGPDGTFTSHGPVTGAPVHVVADGTRYHATRENVHIGRPGVAYPGPTRLEVHGSHHTVHRGEFEIETVAGRHHVRVYTAVVNPASFDMTNPDHPTSPFKDIQQDPNTGKLNISTGSNAQLWAGAGRPQRALQWLAKYEHTDGGRPIDPRRPDALKRPVLRSFLVPLDTFNKITSGATVEGAPGSTSKKDTYNVDQRGEPNQFGIGGDHLAELVKHAEPGSLVSYPANSTAPFDHSELAGRITPAADLYQRLGLGQDFRSDAVGKAYDPWFSWAKQPDGSWRFDGFRNDARRLHEIATELSGHHAAWQQSTPDAGLNRFLNDVGPPSATVDKLTTDVLSTGPGALRDYLGAGGAPAADQAAFQRVLNDRVVPGAVREATNAVDGLVKQLKGPVASRAELEKLITQGFRPKSGPVRTFAEHVVDKAVAQFATKVEQHPDLALLTDDSRTITADALRDRVKQALTDEFAHLDSLEPYAKGGKKGGWLSGPRLTEFGDRVAAHVAAQPLPTTEVTLDPAKLAEVAEHKVLPGVVTAALTGFTGQDLVNSGPDHLRSTVSTDVLPTFSSDLAAALREHPAMSLADKPFRDTMAEAVAQDARTRAERALAGFTFPRVDPAEVDTFMARVPEIANQAEIGAVISTDSDQIALDPRTRLQDGDPFLNTYHQWKTAAPS